MGVIPDVSWLEVHSRHLVHMIKKLFYRVLFLLMVVYSIFSDDLLHYYGKKANLKCRGVLMQSAVVSQFI